MEDRAAPYLGLKRHLRAEVVPGDATYLISDSGVTALQGECVAELVPLLDGTRNLAELLQAVGSRIPAQRLATVLGELMRDGVVRYHPDPAGSVATSGTGSCEEDRRAAEAYWDLAGLDGSAALRAQSAAQVEVIALGDATGRDLVAALRADGLAVLEHPAGLPPVPLPAVSAPGVARSAALVVVLTDDYLRPELAGLDRSLAAAGRSWLLAKTTGASPTVGPLFGSGDGACWNCLSWRLRANRATEVPVRRALGQDGPLRPPPAHTGVTRGLAAHLVALEVSRTVTGAAAAQQVLQSFDSLTGQLEHHRVQRRPQCPTCGDPGLVAGRSAAPVAVRPVPKTWTSGNGHRSTSPEQVLATYGHLVDPVTGVVRELHRDDRAGPGMHCYTAQRNPAARSRDAADLRSGLRALCGGKGTTDLDAKVSAVCESLERYSGQLQGDELRVRASMLELADAAVHPNDVLLYDRRQFGTTDASTPMFQQVDDPFDESAEVDWTPLWSLTARRHRYLPTSLLYFDCSPEREVPPPAGARMATADSNGNAAGSCLEDAIVQGFLELVERDAVALWWYNRTPAAGVDLMSCGDDWVRSQVLVHESLHREMWVLDLTSDLGIPVMAALSRRVDDGREDITFGFGAHLDPQVAVRRAVAELAQMLPGVVGRGCGDLDFRVDDPEADSWYRYAPGRLFDVPVLMGRLPTPTAYADLNPIPIFI